MKKKPTEEKTEVAIAKTSKEPRSRYWSCIIYPEENMPLYEVIEFMRSHAIPCFISPLHDPSKNNTEEPIEEERKRHRHILFVFNGGRRIEWMDQVCQRIGGTRPFSVVSVNSLARYLIHLDDPDKEQLDPEDIITCGSLNYKYYSLPIVDNLSITRDILEFLYNNGVVSYSQFCSYCAVHNEVWFYQITQNRGLRDTVIAFMKSFKYDIEHPE